MTIQARLEWLEVESGQLSMRRAAGLRHIGNQLSSTSDGRNNAKKFLCRILLDIAEVEILVSILDDDSVYQ